jgi:hypothetical protein
MSLKDELAGEMLNIFLNDDEFAESVVYVNRDGDSRTIKAIVDRNDIGGRDETDHGVQEMMTVEVAIHATLGILPSELDNGDALFFSHQADVDADATDSTQKHMITAAPMQGDGSLTFRFGPRLV